MHFLASFLFMLCRPVLPCRWRWLEEIKQWILASQKTLSSKISSYQASIII